MSFVDEKRPREDEVAPEIVPEVESLHHRFMGGCKRRCWRVEGAKTSKHRFRRLLFDHAAKTNLMGASHRDHLENALLSHEA